MARRVIEYRAQCGDCKGSGIYVGLAERDGAGVVCNSCKGTGCVEQRIEYIDFDGRTFRDDVIRVQQVNPGICVNYDIFEFGGVTYADWLKSGVFPPGTEDRKHVCPAWWYHCADYSLKPDWDWCIRSGMFSSCKHFECKHHCWARWDRENAAALVLRG